ncbi:MAG: CD1871A family CXXC motif-containing protein [Eubacteriales bacterium]|nr:CD1871A family CXXC motif-containing protein [Eubacteriales bacterium]
MTVKTTRLLIFGLGLVLLVGGIARGDMLALWRRATQLCLGCIGIG